MKKNIFKILRIIPKICLLFGALSPLYIDNDSVTIVTCIITVALSLLFLYGLFTYPMNMADKLSIFLFGNKKSDKIAFIAISIIGIATSFLMPPHIRIYEIIFWGLVLLSDLFPNKTEIKK